MAGSGYYYELPVPREYVGNYGGLNGNVYGPPPPKPYTNINNTAMQGLCIPATMYRGAVPKVANQFPQSMFARERDGYLKDRLEYDEEDDEDIEPVKTQKDRQHRHNRASKLDEDDEDLEPVIKIPVRSHHTRASYLDSDKDNAPTRTSKARSRYSVASCLDDDGDAEPVMKLEDIEEDLRKLREATSLVVNRFTTKSNAQPSTRLSRFFSSYLNDGNDYEKGSSSSYSSNNYNPSSFSSSYVRQLPSSAKPVESSTYEPPVYDKRHSMYLSSRSTNKEFDSERNTAGKSDLVPIPQETVEPESYSRRRTSPRVSSEDNSKINSRIAVMSKYILSKNKTKN